MGRTTLYDRLLEVCRDAGIDRPTGRDIQKLTGLSSGRVTQIKQAEESAKLGAEALQRVLKRGYSAEWIADGRGEKLDARTAPVARTNDPELIMRAVRALLEAHGLGIDCIVMDEKAAIRRISSRLSGDIPRTESRAGGDSDMTTDNLSKPRTPAKKSSGAA